MTTLTDTAAIAAIGAASRELRLPTVRAEAEHLAEVALRSTSGTFPTSPTCSPPRSTTAPNGAANVGCTRRASPA